MEKTGNAMNPFSSRYRQDLMWSEYAIEISGLNPQPAIWRVILEPIFLGVVCLSIAIGVIKLNSKAQKIDVLIDKIRGNAR